MIESFNNLLDNVSQTQLGKAARRSAGTIWSAHLDAFETTRHEAGRVMEVALKQGQKFGQNTRNKADDVVGELAGAADDQLTSFEKALQKRVELVVHRIGLPTAKDINSLSRRVDALAAKVETRAKAKRAATRRKKTAAKRSRRTKRAA